MKLKKRVMSTVFYSLFTISALVFVAPIVIVFINSFKGQFFITDSPFTLPDGDTFVGLENYVTGIKRTDFISSFGYSLFITLASVFAIVLFCSMAAWFLARVKNKVTQAIYYTFVFSMIVPFQMVMFTMSKVANVLQLDNPLGIVFIYLGFGAGLSIFMFYGFASAFGIF